MNKQAKPMEKKIVGPPLFCKHCGTKKVLSPCFSCLCSPNEYSDPSDYNVFCRGCGYRSVYCQQKYEICKILREKELVYLQKPCGFWVRDDN